MSKNRAFVSGFVNVSFNRAPNSGEGHCRLMSLLADWWMSAVLPYNIDGNAISHSNN